ncbi:MAG: SUMF1/EgtB/PvdO family nonheme iron enzyme, partial [Verrucomicrobiae bacterium]|nr:SUMF1/EgtB/PvdO family nonheme iron enzyme [Verrucomicrobiae bacterium]
QVFDGTAREALAITDPPGLTVNFTYGGSGDPPVGTGIYEVIAEVDDPIYEGSANGMLVVDDPGSMQAVPGGTHGSSGISVETFEMGRYEVTWWLWNQVRNWAVSNGYADLAGIGEGCAGDHPVRGVNWYDAVKWCNARTEWENATLGRHLAPAYEVGGTVYRNGTPTSPSEVICDRGTSGYRLPDARESEFAARGGLSSVGTLFPGSEDPLLVSWNGWNSEGAACDLDETRGTHPVGGLLPNELGFYDIAGNLAEWLDEGPGENAALRYLSGGHWNSNLPELLPYAFAEELPVEGGAEGGFRTVRSVSEALAVALDNEDFAWDSGGDSPWFAQTAEHSDGIDGGASGAVAGGGENWVEAVVAGPGTVSFLWRLQIPAGSGALVLSIDGEERGRVEVATDWTGHEVYVPAGTHLIRWTYSRSLLQDPVPDPLPGPEGAWLDEVAFDPALPPTVGSGSITGISTTGATVSGEILSDGGSPIEERGFLISAFGGATLDNTEPLVVVGTDLGTYSAQVDSLLPGITYRTTAYAFNAAGVGYGEERRFTTDEAIEFDNGAAVRVRDIAGGDLHVFTFTLSSPRHTAFSTSGGASLRAELYDGQGNLVGSSLGDGDFQISELLYAGDYKLHVYRIPDSGPDQNYTLSFDVATVAETLPDAAVGASLLLQTGMGIRGIPSLQTVTLNSSKARPVTGYATFMNGGTLPDELLISGGRGNSFFGVSYSDESGNVTAQVIAGTYRTPVFVDEDGPVAVQVRVVPSKKKLVKKKGKRTVTLKKAITLPLRATSAFDPSVDDTAFKVIRTK